MAQKGQFKYGFETKTNAEYRAWYKIKDRCYSEKCKDYPNYGGRGIKVCAEWVNDFAQFLKDMGAKPSKEYTIERLDNDKDYSPENCKWATRTEQNRNTRASVFLEHNGFRATLAEWAERLGLKSGTFQYRIRQGYTLAEIISYQIDTHRPINKFRV